MQSADQNTPIVQPDSRSSGVTPRERRWVVLVGLGILLATCLPYLVGYLSQTAQMRFTGVLFAAGDTNSYLANLLRGSAGDWLFRTPYTVFPQTGALIFLPFLVLGKLAGAHASHGQLVAIYQIFRLLTGLLVCLATYDFMALFVTKVSLRRWGTLLAVLGGGLGWLALFNGGQVYGSLPVEFISPEVNPFLSLFGLPHLALAHALLLWGLRGYLLSPQTAGARFWRGSLWTGLVWLLTALAQPLVGMLVGAIPLAHLVILTLWQFFQGRQATGWSQWRAYVKRAAVAGLIAAPFALYNALIFIRDPYLRLWNAQSRIPSPHPLLYLLAFGLVLPFAAAGLLRLWRARPQQAFFLAGWVIFFTAAIYVPFSQQRRFIEGVWVALIALGMVALDRTGEAASTRPGWTARLNPVLGLCLIIPVIFLAGVTQTALSRTTPAFEPRDKLQIFEQLAGQAEDGSVVLASYENGNLLPAWAPVRVVFGLETLSANSAQLRTQVQDVFDSHAMSEAERQKLLSGWGVNYVFWGPEERALGDWNPGTADYLHRVTQQGDYALFQVK